MLVESFRYRDPSISPLILHDLSVYGVPSICKIYEMKPNWQSQNDNLNELTVSNTDKWKMKDDAQVSKKMMKVTNYQHMSISSIPSNFSSPFGFFSHVIEFCEMSPLGEHLSIRRLQTVQRSLCVSPLQLTLFLSEILLSCERNLQKIRSNKPIDAHV